MRICFRKKVLRALFVLFAAFYKTPPKNKVIPNKLAIAANIYQKLIFYLLYPYNTICIFIAICFEQTSENLLKKLPFLIKIHQI